MMSMNLHDVYEPLQNIDLPKKTEHCKTQKFVVS